MPDLLTIDEARALVLGAVTPLARRGPPGRRRARPRPRRGRHGRPRRPELRQQRDGRLRRALRAGRAASCGSSASRAPGRPAEVPRGRRRGGAHLDRRRRCPTAPTRSCRSRTPRTAGDVTVARIDLPAGHHVRAPGEDLRGGRRSSCAAGTRLGAGRARRSPSRPGARRCAARARPRVAVARDGRRARRPGRAAAPRPAPQLQRRRRWPRSPAARGPRSPARPRSRDDAEATRAAIGARSTAPTSCSSPAACRSARTTTSSPRSRRSASSEVFWRVALRPGKPRGSARRGAQLVFGLPGNPVSAMVCFMLFARPALARCRARRRRRARARACSRRRSPRQPEPRGGGAGPARRRPRAARPARRARTSCTRCSAPTRWRSSRAATGELPAGAEVEIERI